jgi:hypothetical protein
LVAAVVSSVSDSASRTPPPTQPSARRLTSRGAVRSLSRSAGTLLPRSRSFAAAHVRGAVMRNVD